MENSQKAQNITTAMSAVEHPAIATTLLDLGILRDIEFTPEGQITFSLFLPFPNVPDHIRDHMIQTLVAAAQTQGGEVKEVRLGYMNEADRQIFLAKEQENWRG